MTIDELRALFPHVHRTIYLNHAATGPISTPVLEAVRQYLTQRHETNIENFEAFREVVDSALQRIALLLGSDAARVEFAPNTSYGLNVLAGGLDWRPGDRVAVPSCEFPANVYPFLNLEQQGVAVDFIAHERGVVTMEAVEAALRPETRLLTISWVQFLSGYRSNLTEIGALCRDRDVLFCVDAIQGLGALQLDVKEAGIDFLACGGHKWLMASQGIGFLYVTERLQNSIAPSAGWMHGPVDWEQLDDFELAFHDDASRFRLGSMNHIGVAALDAALELYERAGPAWCEKRVLDLSSRLGAGLEARGLERFGTADPRYGSGIVTVEHPRVEALYEHLRNARVETALRQKKLRFAPTYYNTSEEIDRVLESIDAFA